ncbi:pentapeptide repeat-containing protein [Actinoplanes sp. RD1]|uniref:pentapeptide repeat-containing protein n=1 Tax=Actinoplanes sp. RD1 TaxID=3064538 RepID=UPI002740AC46|nr:pentapeptide repeat-containing protein [Actinoplanes sp. RD1]
MVVAAGTVGLVFWLLDVAGDDPARRLDAIRTAFTAGLTTGGTLALLLTARRQWLQERTQIHSEHVAEDNAERAERIAAANLHDANERRTTELYIKAADQLGSVKAPVRLAGLYALERLGQEDPRQRQMVAKIVCSYLRMPPSAFASRPISSSASGDDLAALQDGELEGRAELEVRKAAQGLLTEHLSPGNAELHWPEVDAVDLTGAHLEDFSLQRASLKSLTLNNATFVGESWFTEIACDLLLVQGVTVRGPIDFRGATLNGNAWFAGSRFEASVRFNTDEFFAGTHFVGFASFRGCAFDGRANFSGARLSGGADFTGSRFEPGLGDPGFGEVIVENPVMESPEVGHDRSVWPEGWSMVTGASGSARLRRRRRRSSHQTLEG